MAGKVRIMTKMLVSIDVDLASSIALRYACQLADLIEAELETIHIEEPDKEGYTPGSGWVRQTWEKALLETGQNEVNRLIKAEKTSCPVLPPPKMFVGDRDEEILRELQRGSYDLFVEGELQTFSAANFHKKIHSRLYRYAPCPVVLVRNLVGLERLLILLHEGVDVQRLIARFSTIFKGVGAKIDLAYSEFHKSREPSPSKEVEDRLPLPPTDADRDLHVAEKMLADQGWTPLQGRVLRDPAEKLGDFLKDYGLVVSSIHREVSKKSDLLQLLSRCPSPILLFWQ
jgi:nucleotide-binding universal stress UspA family protein